MRLFRIVVAMGVVAACATGAKAFETFIPMGTGYSTEITDVPAFDSTRGRVNQEADIIETEIYRLNRLEAQQESRLNRFFSDAEVSGGDESIDY